MRKPKFSPEPWRINRDSRGRVTEIVDADGERVVVTDSGIYPPHGADAHLIAAAPELYEALKEAIAAGAAIVLAGLLPTIPDSHLRIAVNKADAALRKAEGLKT